MPTTTKADKQKRAATSARAIMQHAERRAREKSGRGRTAAAGYKETNIDHLLGRVLILSPAGCARDGGGRPIGSIRWRVLSVDTLAGNMRVCTTVSGFQFDADWGTIREGISEGLIYVD